MVTRTEPVESTPRNDSKAPRRPWRLVLTTLDQTGEYIQPADPPHARVSSRAVPVGSE